MVTNCISVPAAAADDRKVTFWDMDAHKLLSSTHVEAHRPRSLKFGPDGATVLTASQDSLRVRHSRTNSILKCV